jgi:F0F1-type ATP synthase assembly protein I
VSAPPGPVVRYARYGAVAFEFSGTIAAGTMLGWLIDGRLTPAPYGLVAGTLLAVVGGFVRLIQTVQRFDRLDREAEERVREP